MFAVAHPNRSTVHPQPTTDFPLGPACSKNLFEAYKKNIFPEEMRSKGFLETWLFSFLVFGEAEFCFSIFCLFDGLFFFFCEPTNQPKKDESAVWTFCSMFYDFPPTQRNNQRAV